MNNVFRRTMTLRSPLLLLGTALSAMSCAPHRQRATPAAPTTLTWPADLVLADSTEPTRPKRFFPAYPPQLQSEGREAKLVVVYVVDTTGRADLNTVRFLLDAPRGFATSVCALLRKATFEPLRREGQLRPALAIDAFGFYADSPGSNADAEARWKRERPDIQAVRDEIRREGLPAARRELASRPGCS